MRVPIDLDAALSLAARRVGHTVMMRRREAARPVGKEAAARGRFPDAPPVLVVGCLALPQLKLHDVLGKLDPPKQLELEAAFLRPDGITLRDRGGDALGASDIALNGDPDRGHAVHPF